ncbi:hypothetical protein BCR32DRAFT_248975 [Anaeromyces robustus]|uniref:HCNGP-domain-containing protein n=1 Tax=Anaeromyces robustus TaxID=1754192 RepID=A0A1Y1WSD0_9FUNG|nr:hypothetical protein BCR32DRAFT_248975 [Anaeromyces robustus]|eukprot:ORX76156.1 hypothetical protein BCR32DRAFT_248975 [Anaeromyces robustus]
MNGLLNLNYYSDDDSENEDNQNKNNSSNTLNSTINTDSPGLLSLVNYNNDDDSEEESENTDTNSGDVIIYTNNNKISHKKRKMSDVSIANSPRPKKTNSLFASLIRKKVNNNQQKQKNTSKIVNNTDSNSDVESSANPSLAISQLINNTLNNDNSSLKVINLYDSERTLALKKRIADLLNKPKNENQKDDINENEQEQEKLSNDHDEDKINKKESEDTKNENKMNIDNDNNIIDNIKLNLEEYGLPKETNEKCDIELQNRFSEWRYKKSKGLVFDKTFEKDSALEDPFIIRNLIDSLGIKEVGSNFPKDRFDPTTLPKNAHYKELFQIQSVQIPVQLHQGGIGMVPGLQFVPSSKPKTSGINLAEVSAKIQQQIKDAAAKAAAANANINKLSAPLSSTIKQNNIPITITNSINTNTTSSSLPTGHVKKSKWDIQNK